MIVQGKRVLYNHKLQPAQVHIAQDGNITDVVLGYDKRLFLKTDEVHIANVIQRCIRYLNAPSKFVSLCKMFIITNWNKHKIE